MEEGFSRGAVVLYTGWKEEVWKSERDTPRITTTVRQKADTRRGTENILGEKQKWKWQRSKFTVSGTRYICHVD
jgi:hypothetical protein